MKTDIRSEEPFGSAETIRALEDEEMASVSGGNSWNFPSLQGMTGSFTMKVMKGTKMNDVWAEMENNYGDYGKAVKKEVNNIVKTLGLQGYDCLKCHYYAQCEFMIYANNDRITVR